jgi:F-type H+-transporting ATPase subunit a
MHIPLFLATAVAAGEETGKHALEAGTWLDFLRHVSWWPQWLPVQVAWSFLVIILVGLVCYLGSRKKERVPGRVQNVLEMAIMWIEGVAVDVIGPKGKGFAPFLASLFLYIVVMNFFGMIPGFASPTANLNTTVALAIIVFFLVQYHGIRQSGLSYFKHFVGEPTWLFFLNIPLHVMSELVRPVTLALRLYGNISGEDLAILSFILLAVGLPVYMRWIPLQLPLLLLATLTAIVQALIFILLTSIYLSLAGPEEGHEHH